jgi:hypothetical protein
VEKRRALTKQMAYLQTRGQLLQLGQYEAGLSEELPGARGEPPQRGRGPVRRGRERTLGVELWTGGEPVAQLSACFRCVFVV